MLTFWWAWFLPKYTPIYPNTPKYTQIHHELFFIYKFKFHNFVTRVIKIINFITIINIDTPTWPLSTNTNVPKHTQNSYGMCYLHITNIFFQHSFSYFIYLSYSFSSFLIWIKIYIKILLYQHGRSALDTSRTLFLLASTQGVSCRLVMNHLIYVYVLSHPHLIYMWVSVCTFMCIYLFSCPSVFSPQLLIFHREYLVWCIVVVYQS
jgi:hypothetical protein